MKFLDVCCDFVRGLPAHEVCELAHQAAMECTDSTGAALFICRDSASSDVLPASSIELSAIERSLLDDEPPSPSHLRAGSDGAAATDAPAPSVTSPGRGGLLGQFADEDSLVQVAPPLSTGEWPAVTRFAATVLTAGTTCRRCQWRACDRGRTRRGGSVRREDR